MASRDYSVSFRILGALDSQFGAAMQAAQNAMRGLGQAAKQVNAAMAGSMGTLNGYLAKLQTMANQSAKYAQLQSQIPKTQSNLQEQIAKTAELSRAYQQQKNQVDAMKAAMQRLQTQEQALKAKWQSEKSTLQGLKDQLKTLGNAYKEVSASQGKNSADAQRLKSQIDSLKASIASQKSAVDNAKSSYDTLKASLKGAASELKTAESSLKNLGTSFASSKSKVQELYHTLQQQKSALASLKSSLSSAGFSTDHFIQSEMKLRSEIEATTRAIERQAQISARLTNAQDRVNTASTNLGEAQSAFNTVTSAVESVARPLIDATENAMTFEREMSKVQSLTQMRNIRNGNFEKVAAEMAELTAEAERLGATTEFTSTEVAQAMGKYGMAGWNKDQIMAAMQSTLDAASIAGDHNMMRTADVLSDDAMAFGIKAGESYKLASGKVVDGVKYFTDAMAYAWTNANLDRESLHEAWKYNAPGAKAAGLSLGETLAQNMFAANAGIKGSMAGTAFRAGWTRFLAPPKTAIKSLEQAGMMASDATKQIMEAQAALQEAGASENDTLFDKITKAYKYYQTLDEQHKAGWLKNLVGQNALSGWQIAFDKGGIEEIARIAKEIDSGSIEGWASDTAKIMRDNTATAVELLSSAFDKLQRSVGAAMLPLTRSAAEFLNPIITSIAEFVAANPAIVQGIVAIGAALAGVAVLATGVAVAFAGWSFITEQIGMFTAGMTAVRSGMLATEVASLGMTARMGAAFATMSATATGAFTSLRAITWSSLFTGLTAQIQAARVAIMGFFASVASGAAFSNLAAAIGRIGTAFMAAARGAMAFAFSPVGAAMIALALLAYVVYQNWDRLGPVFTNLANTITSAFSNVAATVGPALSALGESVGKIFESLNNTGAGDTIIRVFILILNVVTTVAATIIEVFGQAVKTVADLFTNLADVVSHALNGEFLEAAKSAGNIFVDGFNDSIEVIKASGKILEIPENYQKSMELYNQARTVPTQAATRRHNRYAETQATTPTQSIVPTAMEIPQFDIATMQAAFNEQNQVPPNVPTQVPVPTTTQPTAPTTPPVDVAAMQAQYAAAVNAQSAANAQNQVPPAPVPTPTLDTSTAQQQINALGQATQQPTQNLPQVGQGVEQANQALQNFPQTLEPVKTALSNFPAALEPIQSAIVNVAGQFGFFTGQITFAAGQFGFFVGQITFASGQLAYLSGQAAYTSGQLNFFAGELTTASGQVNFFGTTASGAADNVAFFGTTAGTAAGQVHGMGSAAESVATALQGAASKISNIKITVPTVVAAPAAANYKGGIYNKGAFLTWFAEKSPEAAIPLDRSRRAINLWTQAGQMLGVLPSDGAPALPNEKPSTDSTRRGIFNFQRLKEKRANQIYNSIIAQQNGQIYNTFSVTDSSIESMASTISSISAIQNSVQNLQAAQFDELGNIIGLNGAAGNVITKYDNDKIKQVKKAAQLKEFNQRQNKIADVAQNVPTENASLFSRAIEKVKGLFAGVKDIFGGGEIPATLPDGMANPAYEELPQEPRILTERQRYRSENVAEEKTLDRIRNSKSYQAMLKLQNASNRTSQSVLNRGELNTKLPTDNPNLLQKILFGGLNTGEMFGGMQPVDIMTAGKSSTPIMTPPAVPNQPQLAEGITSIMTSTLPMEQSIGKINFPAYGGGLNTKLPTDEKVGFFDGLKNIFGGTGENILGNIGEIFSGINLGSFDIGNIGGIFGGKSDNGALSGDIITTLPQMPPSPMTTTSSLTERLNAVNSSERLESVAPSTSASGYSAATFQPTFNINITVTGGGENVDARGIGQEIAYSMRDSFEKEFERFMHEKVRRGFV